MSTEQATTTAHDELVRFLDGERFSASELCHATGIKAVSLTNLVNKSNLELCSKNPGRGKQREFCLIDLYCISLMDRIVKIIKDYGEASRAVSDFTFEVPRRMMADGYLPYETDLELKQAFCESVYSAPPEFHERDMENPWFLVWDLKNEPFGTKEPEKSSFLADQGIIILGLTHIFLEVEKRLALLRGFNFAKHGVYKGLAEGIRPTNEDAE